MQEYQLDKYQNIYTLGISYSNLKTDKEKIFKEKKLTKKQR